jgi:putative hydroxymethylpyrimidine transport system substrate-binding protein
MKNILIALTSTRFLITHNFFLIFLWLCLYTTLSYAENLTVILDWFPNPSHAPLFVAKQQGFFNEQNLTVKFIGPADPADPPKLVAVGKADIGLTYQPQFMEQINQGLPLIAIGTLIDHPLNCLAVLKNGPIYSLSDLKGKRVGYSGSTVSNITLKTMLKKAHLTLNDIELINTHYNLTQGLLSHKLDAVIGIMRTFEPFLLEQAGQPVRMFFPEELGMPPYNELIFIVKKGHEADPRYSRFLMAVKKGTSYLRQHPEETWQTFAKEHPELRDELNHKAWMASIPYFAYDPKKINSEEWLQFSRFLQQNE